MYNRADRHETGFCNNHRASIDSSDIPTALYKALTLMEGASESVGAVPVPRHGMATCIYFGLQTFGDVHNNRAFSLIQRAARGCTRAKLHRS